MQHISILNAWYFHSFNERLKLVWLVDDPLHQQSQWWQRLASKQLDQHQRRLPYKGGNKFPFFRPNFALLTGQFNFSTNRHISLNFVELKPALLPPTEALYVEQEHTFWVLIFPKVTMSKLKTWLYYTINPTQSNSHNWRNKQTTTKTRPRTPWHVLMLQ